jgi:hypothetical protein
LGPGGAIDDPPDVPGHNDRYCRPMAEQKVMALVWRDVATSQFRIVSFEYLED